MICIILADFFHKFFLRKKENEDGTIEYEEVEASTSQQVEIAEYSIFTVVSFLSNLMQKVEWQTYENGEEIKSAEHYLLNVRPNPNQSASDFWYELFARMLLHGKAIVFRKKWNGAYWNYIDDGCSTYDEGNGIEPYRYENIGRGNFRIPTPLAADDVFVFRYGNPRAKALVSGLCAMYGEMMKNAASSYENASGQKGILKISAYQTGDQKQVDAERAMLNKRFAAFFKARDAVMPLKEPYTYTQLNAPSSADQSSDIAKNMRAEALSAAAIAFGVSPSLVSGTLEGTSDALDLTLTVAVDSLKKIVETEINGKLYKPENILNGNYIRGDSTKIRHIDIFHSAESIDKLISSGYFTINETRLQSGKQKSNDPIADERLITKNYDTGGNLINNENENAKN